MKIRRIAAICALALLLSGCSMGGLIPKIDLEGMLPTVDLEGMLPTVDLEGMLPTVDFEALMPSADLEDFIAEAPTKIPTFAEETQAPTEPQPATEEALPVGPPEIDRAEATSYLTQKKYTHGPENVFDGDLTKAWCEDASGYGMGQSLTVYLKQKSVVSGMRIWAGYHKSSSLYYKNSRPALLLLEFSDGEVYQWALSDAMEEQEISLPGIRTEYVKITIMDVYSGTKYEDTLITEIELY
jgi:hypothetical protein